MTVSHCNRDYPCVVFLQDTERPVIGVALSSGSKKRERERERGLLLPGRASKRTRVCMCTWYGSSSVVPHRLYCSGTRMHARAYPSCLTGLPVVVKLPSHVKLSIFTQGPSSGHCSPKEFIITVNENQRRPTIVQSAFRWEYHVFVDGSLFLHWPMQSQFFKMLILNNI